MANTPQPVLRNHHWHPQVVTGNGGNQQAPQYSGLLVFSRQKRVVALGSGPVTDGRPACHRRASALVIGNFDGICPRVEEVKSR